MRPRDLVISIEFLIKFDSINHLFDAGSTNIVKFLIENGADLSAKNNRGQTPRELVLWISENPNEKCKFEKRENLESTCIFLKFRIDHEHMWIATILQNAEEKQKQMEKFKRPQKQRCLFGVLD